jgi:nicotinate dehydrogenase subunit A
VSTSIRVNGKTHSVAAASDTPLLYVLRNDLGFDAPKFGCGLAQCGACAVLKDGKEIRSCVTPLSTVGDSEIVTNDGLGATSHDPVQAAFVAEQAAQCGYCTSGMIVAASALLKKNPKPTRAEIVAGMNGHLCRCNTYLRIVRAVERASHSGGAA